MTLECPSCGTQDITLADDNGASYPNTRVEFWECGECGNKFKKVLTA